MYTYNADVTFADACNLSIADHFATLCCISCSSTSSGISLPHRIHTYRSFKKFDIELLKRDLQVYPWNNIIAMTDIDGKVHAFTEAFLSIWSNHAPLITRRNRHRPTPWMTKEVLDYYHTRNKAYRSFLLSRSEQDLIRYKQLRNEATRQTRLAKRQFFMKGASSGTRHFWKNIKNCTGFGKLKTFVHPWPDANINLAKNSANKINSFFIETVSSVTSKFIANCHQITQPTVNSICEQWSLQDISEQDILKAIASLPNNSSTGNDNISAKMLKYSGPYISHILVDIFNSSINSGIFPHSWKQAIVVPVHKKGNYFDIANYRPIALLPLLSKVFEKTINLQLCDYLSSSAILHDAQHGFRKSRSCESALLRITKLLFGARIAGLWSCLVTIDYSKAFDTLDHELLLQAACSCGISSATSGWLQSYLNGRSQRVKYGGALSESATLTHGVPQGSVLGPTLFNIFINRLLNCLPNNCSIAYADDITLISHGDCASSATNNMQLLLDTLYSWSLSNKLSVNAAKCFSLIISPKIIKRPTQIVSLSLRLGTTPIVQTNATKILGVTLTDDLSWDTHAKSIRSSVNSMVGILRRFSSSLNTDTRLKIFNAFILPRITYCLPVWGNGSATATAGLDRTLLRSARIILNSSTAVLDSSVFSSTAIMPFSHLVFSKNVICIFKLLLNQTHSQYLCSDLLKDLVTHSTRSSDGRKFYSLRHKRQRDELCFQCRAIRDWNSLPASVTKSTKLNSFQNSITYIIQSKLT
jgi:hypothetical protein